MLHGNISSFSKAAWSNSAEKKVDDSRFHHHYLTFLVLMATGQIFLSQVYANAEVQILGKYTKF